jgi:hypothetical protein
MATRTTDAKQLYTEYDARHPDDRSRLFDSVARAVDADRVLYPGSYIDIAPSFHFDDVTYVDTDRRAARFFAQHDTVHELVATHRNARSRSRSFRLEFHHLDYMLDLPIPDESIDLLVSLYAGFVSEYCARYLGVGGHVLVNSSHGDAAMASIDPRLRLVAVVDRRDDRYHVRTQKLDQYLIPKRGTPPTRDELHQLGRGIAYTRSPAVYLFEKTRR